MIRLVQIYVNNFTTQNFYIKMHSDYKDTIKTIAERVRATRKSQNMTIQELAYRCDMERSNMSRIESGRVNITIKTLFLISKALDVSINYLIGNDES